MRFRKGVHYEHPPRGRARKPYTMSGAARRQRCGNLRRTRLRSDTETNIIKRLVWQSFLDGGPRPSQRALGRQLGVRHSYVHKVQEQAHSVGMEAILRGRRVTVHDLADARRFTAGVRELEPGLLAPSRRLYEGEPQAADVPRGHTADEIIAERWREAHEEQRRNPCYIRRRVLFTIPIR